MAYEGLHGDNAASLLSKLVSIDSVNPSLVPGASGEGPLANFVAEWFADHGLEVEASEVLPGRPNVVARVPGKSHGRSLMLNAHLDTVGVAGMEHPFQPRTEGDRLFGRGAYDMKGGLAAVMLAAVEIARAGGAGGAVVVAAVVDEEYASLGTQALLQDLKTDGAVVTEPTGLRLCLAHKGFAWLEIETRGRAAHGSKPELGVDAIAHMGRFLTELEHLEEMLGADMPHHLLGTGSVHASLIEGGQELSSYPERCRLQIERRTIPGETERIVVRQIEGLLDRLHSRDDQFAGKCELTVWRDPFEVEAGQPVVLALERAARTIIGKSPEVYGDTPWMDAALLSAAGIPTVVFGPGGAGAHAVTEYASLVEVEQCASVLTEMAFQFCAESASGRKAESS
jgi:acetylornithine deacetylase